MLSQLILSCLFATLVKAQDLSTPCISGTCTYQTGDGSSVAYSVLTINTESATSLSDITEAAGWDIVECDPYSIEPQDIRLVCADRSKGCDHLFEGGEKNTIVRLPDSCAGGPFARVVRSWISDNQTIPARLRKRQIDAPVRALTLDFDFSQIPESNGKVYITASATNSQAQRDAMIHSAAKRSLASTRHVKRTSQAKAVIREFVEASEKRSPTVKTRGRFDWVRDAVNSVGNTASNAVGTIRGARNQVRDALQDGANAVASGVQEAAGVVNDGLHQSGNSPGEIVDTASGAVQESMADTTWYNKTGSKRVHLVDIDRSFHVWTASLSCSDKKGTLEAEAGVLVTAKVRAKLDADFGFIIAGSIVPPKIDDFALTSRMTGRVAAVFDINANVEGSFDTGIVSLLESGLPGLSYPGILTVGPSISLNARAKAFLGVTADLKVSSSFELPQVSLVFPSYQGRSAAQVTPQKTPIGVDVGASAEMKGLAEVHIIPRVGVGLEILAGAAKTTVFLNVDGSAAVDFTLSVDADATPISETEDQPAVSLDHVETKFRGSLNADEGVSIDARATASLTNIYTHNTAPIKLYSKTFSLVRKIFGNPVTRRSALLERADTAILICPASGEIKTKQRILDVPAATPQQ